MGERLKWARLAVVLVMALAAVGCYGGDDEQEEPGPGEEAEAPPEEETGDELIVGTTEPVSTIDPARCNDHACATVIRNTTNTLFGYPPAAEEVEATPELVDGEPEVEPSQLTYSLTLRDDVRFHDGSEMTSEDVKFSLERARDIAHPEGAGHLLAGIESIETPDRLTVEISLLEPDVNFEAKLAHHVAAIVPADGPYTKPDEQLEDRAEAEQYLNEDELVGTGPYRLVDHQEGELLSFEVFEEHWDAPPNNEGVTTRIYGDGAELLAALEAGEVHVAYRHLTPQQEDELPEGEVEIVEGDGAEPRYLVLNPALAPFDDDGARRALAAAVDRQALVDDVLGGDGTPLYSVVPADVDGSEPVFEELYEDAAPEDFLDEEVSFALHIAPDRSGETEVELAQGVERTLEETGLFDVEIQETDWATFREEAWPGDDGEYPAFLLGWHPGDLEPDSYIEALLSTAQGTLAMHENEDLERLREEASTAEEPEAPERQEALRAIQRLAAEEAWIIPLVEAPHVAYAREEVSGVEDALDETQIFRYWVMWTHE